MAHRGAGLGTVLIAAAMALGSAGCIELVEDAEAAAPPEASSDQAPGAPPGRSGAISGTVKDSLSVPIGGASVVLLGTDLFRITDATGRFAFDEVLEGVYTLRVDAAGFQSFEADVQVIRGMITRLEIVLNSGGCQPHMHDMWGDRTEVVIADLVVDFKANQSGDANLVSTVEMGVLDPTLGGPAREIPLPPGALVFPGTERMEIVFNWSTSLTTTVDELGFAFRSANGGGIQQLAAQGAGDPWSLGVSDAMTDGAHNRTTAWKVYFYHTGGSVNLALDSFHAKITIFKGTVPLEGCEGHQ